MKKNILEMSLPDQLKVCLIAILLSFIQISGVSKPIHITSLQGDTVRKTIPYILPWDDMPIDLSFIFEKEKPAGKHGFLKVVGDKFVFEDETKARFLGTTFNGDACFPPHEYSEKVAKRLSKTGINIVRLCVFDLDESIHNIFRFTSGENRNTQNFDPESMDRLDYLFYCLKREGIYMYFDGLVMRKFKTSDGVEAADKLDIGGKPYSIYNRRLIELQEKYNYDLWTHINPYTKLAFKDDPAIVLMEITNENNLWSHHKITLEPYRSELEELYRAWAAKRNIRVSKEKVKFDTKPDININNFFIDITKDYYSEMMQHLRETGVKIPIAGSNWPKNTSNLSAEMVTDFTDNHDYWNLREFDITKTFDNSSMTGSNKNMISNLAFGRIQDKPFCVSEWLQCYPNEWRAESLLLMASIGSFQGWGGIIAHAYGCPEDAVNVGSIANPINKGIYAGNLLTFNDPAHFGLYYHAALIFLRGDVKQADKIVNVKIDDLFTSRGIKALQLTPEKHRVEMVLPGLTAKGDIVVKPDDTVVDLDMGEVLSDTKEIYRNLIKRIGWIDTPNTKAVYGFLGKEGNISLTNMRINVKTDFATVAISTLTDEPIKSSTNMLLTAIGRADNTNSKYNKDHTEQLDLGIGPILVEVIKAAIEIETDKRNLRVIAISPNGFRQGIVPSEYKDGVLRFEIGKEFKEYPLIPATQLYNPRNYHSMFYLIEAL